MKLEKLRFKTGKLLEKMEHALRYAEDIKIYLPKKTSPILDHGSRRVVLQRKRQELTWSETPLSVDVEGV